MPPRIAALDPTLLRCYGIGGGRHEHDHAQLLFGVDGRLDVEVEGRPAFVDAACGLVVPAGRSHTYHAERAARVLVIDIDAQAATERFRRFALPGGWRALPFDALLAAVDAAPSLQPRRRLDLDGLLSAVDADLARPWTLAELARASHLSPARFRARFAELTGLPPLAFVRARRMERASALLQRGFALEAVALQVGYASASALSFALRRERDTGARELRRRSQPPTDDDRPPQAPETR